MIINNINPDLLSIGPFSIRFYGIVYAMGFVFLAYLLSIKSSQGKIRNLTKDRAYDLATYIMLGGIIGARIFHVITDFYLYENNLLGIFAIWQGGLGFQGGFIGSIIAILVYCKKKSIDTFRIMDEIALPVPFFIAMGRLANYFNSENFGPATDLPWCVVFEKIDSVCRHPTMIYEAILQIALFFILLLLYKKASGLKRGVMLWSFVAGYGFIRLFVDSLRILNVYLFGLSHTQAIGLLMLSIGAWKLILINRAQENKKAYGK